MRIRSSLAVCVAIAMAFLSASARASYTISIQQVGPDVVASGSGSIDTTDLTTPHASTLGGMINASEAQVYLGPAASASVTQYAGLTGLTSLGTGNANHAASSGSGSTVGVQGNSLTLFVPAGYTSGSPLGTTSDTWSNQTLSGFGFTPGTYQYTWGTGPDADSLTLQIGTPEPTGVSLLAGGGLALLRRSRRR